MATADTDEPLKRSSSYHLLPPYMSELRILLLGNSWAERSSVGNLILRKTVFNTEDEPDFLLVRKQVKEKDIVLINTPDLLLPDMSLEELTKHVENCVRLSAPGPHVFLLVLQPENFSEEYEQRMQSILETFGDQSFHHSLALISTGKDDSSSSTERCVQQLKFKDLIRKCTAQMLWQKNPEHRQQLLAVMGNIVKESNGDHVSCDAFEETPSVLCHGQQRQAVGVHRDSTKHTAHELRIVLFGKSDDKKAALGNIILGEKEFNVARFFRGKVRVAASGEWNGKPLTVVKTPDVFSLTLETLRDEMKKCVDFCNPGPNVLLLLVKPSDFTEEDRKTLKFILSLFGQQALKHALVIRMQNEWEQSEYSYSVDKLTQNCRQRQHSIDFDKKDLLEPDRQELMQKIENIISDHRGRYLTLTEEVGQTVMKRFKPPLNLVLCGRRRAGKTSAINAILGQGMFGPPANYSECVKNQGEVYGHWVSLVELPALYGKPQKAVMEESFRSISLCDSEGIHAFILVLPVGPLTDDDKGELKTMQNTFGAKVNDFTMILFTVDSDPTASASVNFIKEDRELQQLCQTFGQRYAVFNIKDTQQVSNMLAVVGSIRRSTEKPQCYTAVTFLHAQMDKVLQQEQLISIQHSELEELKRDTITCDEAKQSPETLRIVLIGKTGSGKSSSGNTILGRKIYKAESSQKSVTKYCQKEVGEVHGRPIVVVDTPGLFDSTLSNDEINDEMVKCISSLAPGPHVFLLVFAIGRFTPEEKETLNLIKKAFGKNSEKFTIILFTGGDSLEEDGVSIEDYIKDKCDDSFRKLVADCGGRYHVFNNRNKQNHSQVMQLITKIDTMVRENGSSCYTNEMLQEAEAAIQKEMERILKEKEEEMQREREQLQRTHEEEKEALKIKMEEQRAEIEKERKLKDDLHKQMEERIKNEHEQREKEQQIRHEEDRKKKAQDEIQQVEWGQKIKALEEKIRSESESKEITDRKLEESREEMRKQQEIWEKERKEWWEKRHQEDEERRQDEQRRHRKLEEEYKEEREKSDHQRKEEDRNRREQEEQERKELEKNYKRKEEEMKKKFEEEARKQAEEFNEFRDSKEKDFASLIDKHMNEVKNLKLQHEKNIQEKQAEYKRLTDISEHKQKSLTQEMDELQDKHKEEVTELILLLLTQQKENKKEVNELKEKHKKERDKLAKEFEMQKREEMEESANIKKKHDAELIRLQWESQTQSKDKQDIKMEELSSKHQQELRNRKWLLKQQSENRKEQFDKLRKQHEEEMNEFKKKVLDENKRKNKEKADELKRKHDEEIQDLKQRIPDGDSQKEKINELMEKHKEEMADLEKKLLFPEEGWCSLL